MKLIEQTSLASGHRVTSTFMAAGLFLGLLTIIFVPPAHLPFSGCAFHAITGHSCPTCGMTRSLHAISHGDLAGSLHYHMLGPIVFVGMLLGLLIFATEAISGKQFPLQIAGKRKLQLIMLLVPIWFVYWGVRLIAECLHA